MWIIRLPSSKKKKTPSIRHLSIAGSDLLDELADLLDVQGLSPGGADVADLLPRAVLVLGLQQIR